MIQQLRQFEIPGLVTFETGRGDLLKTKIATRWSNAEIYLHGAQVTSFQKHGEPPLLFLSRTSRFAADKPIRGGVPICFPWFGPRDGDVAHGFARLMDWDLVEAVANREAGATLRFRLPETAMRDAWRPLHAQLMVRVTDTLAIELLVTNTTQDLTLEFETCLHTYFAVGDAREISITGLGSTEYLDKTNHDAAQTESSEPIRIHAQTDRTYLDTTSAVEVHDPVWRRTILVDKIGSASTVIWNPWTTQLLPDLSPEEYRQMICVESGNVQRNRLTLPPGNSSKLQVVLSSQMHP